MNMKRAKPKRVRVKGYMKKVPGRIRKVRVSGYMRRRKRR